MNLKSFLSITAVFSALLLCVFTVNLYSQTAAAEKTGSVAGYISDKEAEAAGITRKRTIENESAKVTNKLKPTESEVLDFEKLTFALVNQKRAENGLAPLTWSDEVARIAKLHSENMVKFNFFGHKDAEGKSVDDRADTLGIKRWTLIGENIAYNRGYKNPLETAVEKWLLSPTHRQNILDERWKEAAIGIAVTADGTYYFTQVFLKRR